MKCLSLVELTYSLYLIMHGRVLFSSSFVLDENSCLFFLTLLAIRQENTDYGCSHGRKKSHNIEHITSPSKYIMYICIIFPLRSPRHFDFNIVPFFML